MPNCVTCKVRRVLKILLCRKGRHAQGRLINDNLGISMQACLRALDGVSSTHLGNDHPGRAGVMPQVPSGETDTHQVQASALCPE